MLQTPIAGERTDVARVQDLRKSLDTARPVFIRAILPRQALGVGEVGHAHIVLKESVAAVSIDVDRIGSGTMRRADAFTALALARAANRRRTTLGLPLLDIAKGREEGRQGPRPITTRRI